MRGGVGEAERGVGLRDEKTRRGEKRRVSKGGRDGWGCLLELVGRLDPLFAFLLYIPYSFPSFFHIPYSFPSFFHIPYPFPSFFHIQYHFPSFSLPCRPTSLSPLLPLSCPVFASCYLAVAFQEFTSPNNMSYLSSINNMSYFSTINSRTNRLQACLIIAQDLGTSKSCCIYLCAH